MRIYDNLRMEYELMKFRLLKEKPEKNTKMEQQIWIIHSPLLILSDKSFGMLVYA